MKVADVLARNVYIENDRFCLETELVSNTEYAFYLHHKNGTEKVSYSLSHKIELETNVESGDYSARFFYKKEGIVDAVTLFFVVDNQKNIYSVESNTVINEPGYSIDYYDNNSSTTFIVFNGDGTKKTTAGFGLGFLVKLGYNVVAVKQDNNCYQTLSFEKFKEVVQPITEGKKISYMVVHWADTVQYIMLVLLKE